MLDDLIERAARRMYYAEDPGVHYDGMGAPIETAWEDETGMTKRLWRARAAEVIDTVAADLYDEGYTEGRLDGECLSYTPHTDRPYRASERA